MRRRIIETASYTIPVAVRRPTTSTSTAKRLNRESTARVPHSSRLYRDGWGGCPLATGPCPVRFDFDAARLAGSPVAGAAPGPVLGPFGEGPWGLVSVGGVDSFC